MNEDRLACGKRKQNSSAKTPRVAKTSEYSQRLWLEFNAAVMMATRL